MEQPPHQPPAPPQLPTLAVFRKHHNLPFYLLVAGSFLFLTIARTAQPGMFLDGVTYASIARNLAVGVGTFWSPSYSATVTWSIVNNMLEATVAVFTTLAVFALVQSLRAAGTRAWLWASLSGSSVIAAVLTKGPAGFFPIAAPVLLPFRSALRQGLVMLATIAAAGARAAEDESRLSRGT